MHKLFLMILMGWVILLGLSGCLQTEDDFVVPPQQPTSTIPARPEARVEETVVEEPPQVITPEIVVPKPVLADEIPSESKVFECDELFCQQNWPGWLQRPIGEGFVRTIDRSYPYASTGDGTLDLHHGVEFPNGHGTPVLAAQSGQVVFAGMDNMEVVGPFGGFYGNVIILRHAGLLSDKEDVYTLYAHLSQVNVEVGDQVPLGEVIGEVGATGAADGSHLHFEVRVSENDYAHTVNPVLWFPPIDDPDLPGTAVLAGVILDRGGTPVPQFPLTLEKIGEEGSVEKHYYPKTYYPAGVNGHPYLGENFVIPDIPAGDYRLAFISGRLYEFYFTLEPGSLGFLSIQLD
jgi:murein DD-endopeptidase MepM/ murein hydrolase activator NlpD